MVIFKEKNGSVAIMTLAAGANKEEAIRKFKEAHAGKYVEHYEGEFEVPESREHRNAWTFKDGRVVVDKTKIGEKQ